MLSLSLSAPLRGAVHTRTTNKAQKHSVHMLAPHVLLLPSVGMWACLSSTAGATERHYSARVYRVRFVKGKDVSNACGGAAANHCAVAYACRSISVSRSR